MSFFRSFLIFTTIILCLTLGFIFSIDPYDQYGINVFGFETKAVAMARENKFNMFEHAKSKYDVVLIGSSSAHRVATQELTHYTGKSAFNYAVQHTTPEDYIAILRHVIGRNPPKLILLSMDFYTLNKNFATDTRFYTSPLKKFLTDNPKSESTLLNNNYFTLEAIRDSFKVIFVNLSKTARHTYLADGNYNEDVKVGDISKVTQFSYSNYEIDPKRVKLLQEFQALCTGNNIELIVYTSPVSLLHFQKIQNDPHLRNELVKFKETLKSVFGSYHDFLNDGIQNFNTTEYFLDSTHPSKKLSQTMMQIIFENKPVGEFGTHN